MAVDKIWHLTVSEIFNKDCREVGCSRDERGRVSRYGIKVSRKERASEFLLPSAHPQLVLYIQHFKLLDGISY